MSWVAWTCLSLYPCVSLDLTTLGSAAPARVTSGSIIADTDTNSAVRSSVRPASREYAYACDSRTEGNQFASVGDGSLVYSVVCYGVIRRLIIGRIGRRYLCHFLFFLSLEWE